MVAFTILYSTCCGAEAVIKNSNNFLNQKEEIIMYHQCSKCGKRCNVTDEKPKKRKRLLKV